MAFSIRPIVDDDRPALSAMIARLWGEDRIITRGEQRVPSTLPGFFAEDAGEVVGLITFHIRGDQCEIVTLDSYREGVGIGSALIEMVKRVALEHQCRRLWLITTNDNVHALRFYQRSGFVLAALYPGAINESRKLKPSISEVGLEGIPIRDEIELEMSLSV
jgi:ribosomal protein S18 acetylase RimI-like enzyme